MNKSLIPLSSKLRVLLIGGSGFLSGTLARTALAQGHEVTVLTRGQRPVPDGVKQMTRDRQDRAGFARHFAELGLTWDLVVDTIPYSPEDAAQDVEVFSGKTGRLVFVSTDFVYDPQHRKNPQSERADVYATAGYGGQKRAAEAVLEKTAAAQLPWTILRPSHIYGPGSWPGCLPLHGRDPQLIETIRAGQTLRLVGGGRFLQHPIFAPDLAATILSTARHPGAVGQIFNVAGPDIIESQVYYRVLGQLLDREVTIEDVPVAGFLAEHPDKAPFCCDRVYDLSALQKAGLDLPATQLKDGLRQLLETCAR